MLESVKIALRISASTTAYDSELASLIDAAKADLNLSGVHVSRIADTDALIKRAIIVYCKAAFGLANPDSEKYQKSYDTLKTHLTLSLDYNTSAPDEGVEPGVA